MFSKYNSNTIYKGRDKVNKFKGTIAMSVFKVKLNNTAQGLLDKRFDAGVEGAQGSQFTTSIQRTIYVAGPGKKYRKLFDGDTFTDCNYWKRFAYPQVPLSEAFIEVVTDDGSVYSDVSEENTFPRVYNIVVASGSEFDNNEADILGDNGGYATFVQITNKGANDVDCRINDVGDAVITIGSGETQVFNSGDLLISKLNFEETDGATTVQVLVSVKSACNS